ncbi:MAG: hypothetical protein MHMPM18_002785 [Marteilia pararefringens]
MIPIYNSGSISNPELDELNRRKQNLQLIGIVAKEPREPGSITSYESSISLEGSYFKFSFDEIYYLMNQILQDFEATRAKPDSQMRNFGAQTLSRSKSTLADASSLTLPQAFTALYEMLMSVIQLVPMVAAQGLNTQYQDLVSLKKSLLEIIKAYIDLVQQAGSSKQYDTAGVLQQALDVYNYYITNGYEKTSTKYSLGDLYTVKENILNLYMKVKNPSQPIVPKTQTYPPHPHVTIPVYKPARSTFLSKIKPIEYPGTSLPFKCAESDPGNGGGNPPVVDPPSKQCTIPIDIKPGDILQLD